jgi:hypothetical protein
LISFYTRYPIFVEVEGRLFTYEKPVYLSANISGDHHLLFKGEQTVNRGDTVLYLVDKNGILRKLDTSSIIGNAIYIIDYKKKGETGFLIEPSSREYIAQFEIPQKDLPDIQPGQYVSIEIKNYPSERFGYINGKVDVVTPGLKRGSFIATVKLTNSTKTTKGIVIDFGNTMDAKAHIEISNENLMYKIFSSLMRQNK